MRHLNAVPATLVAALILSLPVAANAAPMSTDDARVLAARSEPLAPAPAPAPSATASSTDLVREYGARAWLDLPEAPRAPQVIVSTDDARELAGELERATPSVNAREE